MQQVVRASKQQPLALISALRQHLWRRAVVKAGARASHWSLVCPLLRLCLNSSLCHSIGGRGSKPLALRRTQRNSKPFRGSWSQSYQVALLQTEAACAVHMGLACAVMP